MVWKLWKNTKFQLNISKITPARPKTHRDMGCEYYSEDQQASYDLNPKYFGNEVWGF